MLVPRIGALLLLAALGAGLARLLELMVVAAREDLRSSLLTLLVLAPLGVVATASALLVLLRHPLGRRLVPLLLVLAVATATLLAVAAPPIGTFLESYEQSRLVDGVEVPEWRASQGWTAQRYVESIVNEFRLSGSFAVVGLAILYAILVYAKLGLRPRARQRPQ